MNYIAHGVERLWLWIAAGLVTTAVILLALVVTGVIR
jgi:hypothetical protein